MEPMRIRKVAWLALLVVAFLVIVVLLSVIRITPENRTYIIGWEVDPPDQVATNDRGAYGLCGGASPRGCQAAWNSASVGTASREFRSRTAEQGGRLVAHDDDYRGPQEVPPPD